MQTEDLDQSNIITSMSTPFDNETNTLQEYPNLESSSLPTDGQDISSELSTNIQQDHNSIYESSNESDVHDERSTEASEVSEDTLYNNHPTQLQTQPVDKIIDKTLQTLSSQDRDDICSPEQETESTFSSVTSELDNIFVTKPTETVSVVKSLCIPFTDTKDDISTFKQSLTTTITITDYTEPKKYKNNPGHIMISYNHSTRPLCTKIAQALKNLNYIVWIDQDNISGDVFTSMASAVENAFIVLMAVNEKYYQSRYCRLEAEYSMECNKHSIPMLMQADYKPLGWLGIINGSKLHIDFTKYPFDEAFNSLRREIDAIRQSLGIDLYDQTYISTCVSNIQSLTTISNSRNYFQKVPEWNADDVIEWLNQEKLEIFENSLRNFTGATLWQLYKIKFDSAADYYRTVDALLPSTIPLRLFYNLSFNAALESLFSSSHPSSRS